MSLRTELAVRTESFMGIGDGQGSKQLKLAPKILKGSTWNPYGLEGYMAIFPFKMAKSDRGENLSSTSIFTFI